MKWFADFYSRKIRLTDERLEHIELDHPEMSGQIDQIGETLATPISLSDHEQIRKRNFSTGIIQEPLLVENTYVLSLK